MEGVSARKAMATLPSYISALMQNLNPEEMVRFQQRLERLRASAESDQVKALILGLFAMNYAGIGVLRAAVDSLATEIRQTVEKTADGASDTVDLARDTVKVSQEVVAAVQAVAAA